MEQARRAGAAWFERAPVLAVERFPTHVAVSAGKQRFEGRVLIVADGANGPTAKLAGVEVRRQLGIALEANITPTDGYPSEWSNVFGLDVGSIPGGYGWLFPKGDHLNIGVGGLWSTGASLRRRLDALTRAYGFDPHQFWGLRGHPLPVRMPGSPLVDGNVLLVGDAAGLVDALTGEGIFSAVWSGRAAARRTAEYLEGRAEDLSGYARDVERGLIADLSVALQLRDLFHVAPGVWAELIRRSPGAWQIVCRLLTGDSTYSGVKRRFLPISIGVDLMSRMVHAMSRVSPA
jgi:flavin-dependent dehydrogenase